jgi:dolichyl-phosphate beta-glucosyltransferase
VSSSFSVSIILPAYNEVKTIAKTIELVNTYFEQRQYAHEIIVCADGNDGTRELVTDLATASTNLRVIGNVERRGKGYGIRSGMALAQGDIVGFVDADNKTPIEEFEHLEPWLRQGYEVVIGSRALPESRIERAQPLYRRMGSAGFGVFMHAVVGLPGIVDTQCGFKFFQKRAALDLFGRQRIDGYMFDIEILYLAQHSGYQIAQVPVRWRDDGDSRLALVSGNIRNLIDIFRIRFGNASRSDSVSVRGELESEE